MLVTSALITGLGLGSMYGLLALGFHVTYVVSATVNFAQGSSMMLGAVLTYTFAVRLGWPLPLAAALALALCALYGVLVEILAVRPFAARGSNAWLMATVALGIVADNTVLFTFGKEPRGFPMPLNGSLQLAGINVSYVQLAIPAVGLLLAWALSVFSRKTKYGKAMLAGVAGIMIAPLANVNSDMGTVFGLKAFAVAILGGITSAWGVMLAGLIFGTAEALITATLGSGYTQILTFTLVIVALALRPNGLFGRAAVKKV